MAQDNPHRKKHFTFFGKTRSEAHQSSDLQPPPGQSRPGSFTSLRSKAKDLVTRRAGQPKPSQGNYPSADVAENSAQLIVTEEGANELPNTSANHPSVSLEEPPSDGNHIVSTLDQHAQLQSSKLAETGGSMHEGQTVHNVELNDSATGVTNKPDSEEITAHCAEPNDSATHADSKPDSEGVDAARLLARQEVAGLKPIFGPVQAVASGINDAGDPVAAVDYVTPLLQTVSKFNSIVDTIAEIHPYAKAAWGVLSVVPKTIISQTTRDESLQQLLLKMEEVYEFLTEADLENIKTMKTVVTKICQQTLECSYFIRDYSKSKNFWTRLGKNIVSEADKTVTRYNAVFDDLMQQFRDRAVRDTVVVVHRMLEGIQELMEGADLSGMKCAEGAGLDTRKKCLPGTREEILDEITTWINDTEDNTPRVFWLHGNAGTGKSSIAHTIADRFRGLGRLGSCYCFDRTRAAQRRHEKVFTTIARGLADRDEQMRHALADVVHDDNSLTNTPDIMQQWKELIMKPASKLSEAMVGPTLIVIEALDESGDDDTREHLLRILAGKVDEESCITKLPPNFRILLTSRPLPDIYSALQGVEHVRQMSMESIPSASTEGDILHYVTNELSDVDGLRGDTLLSSLAREAGGLFEWARLACTYLKRDNDAGLTARERFQAIISHHKDDEVPLLDNMYKFTLKSIFPPNQPQRKARLARFRSVMAQVLGTLEPLPLASLRSMRGQFAEENNPDIVSAIVKPMAALLSGIADSSAVVRPLHASFPDFLTDRKRSGEFFIDTSGVHKDLAFASLAVMERDLRFNICHLPSSYLPNSEISDLDERVKHHISPELSYSCRFWTDHLRKATFNLGLAEAVRAFFNHTRLLFWFEALSLLKILSIAGSLSSVIEWVEPHPAECKDISDDAADAQRFIRMFGLPISFSTPHLYVSALPFSPKESRIFTKFAHAFPSVLRIVSGHNVSWPVIQQVMRAYAIVTCVAFSPDGKRIVLGLHNGPIQVWDAETGERLRLPLVEHEKTAVNSVAFSPDGKRIVSGSEDKTIRLWDVETGELLRPPLEGHEDEVTSAAFSPNGKHIVSGSRDKTIRLWDAETGQPLRPPLKGHIDFVTSVAFSPDGTRIVSGSSDHTIQLWSAETGEPLQPPLKGHDGCVRSVAFSPDGKRIASGSDDKTIRVWDAETGEPVSLPFQGHEGLVTSVAFSPNCKHIVSGSQDCTIRLWDVETGKPLRRPLEGHRSFVTSVAFSPDGKRILSGSYDATFRLWESTTGEPLHPPLVQHDFIKCAAFMPDGKCTLSWSADNNTICLWDAETGELLRPPLQGPKNDVPATCVAFSPDGKRVVLGLFDSTVLLFDSETGKLLLPPFKGHTNIISLAFSPDGKRIVSGSYDKTIRLWDAETGKLLGPPLVGHEEPVFSVAFSPNGKHIVSGSMDCTIRLWDTETSKLLIPPLVGHQSLVVSVRFSPDGKHIVSGSCDKTIRLWDAKTGECLRLPLAGHERAVTSVAFSPDGKRIVSGSMDNTVRLWDAKSGEPLQLLIGHDKSVTSVSFSPGGQRIMSLSNHDTMRLWDVETAEKLQPYLIRFSMYPGHSLADPAILLDEITAPTQDTSALPVRIRDDKWAVIGPRDRLLFWVPPTYNPRWWPPGMRWIVPALDHLDLSHMAHGLSWESCNRTHAHV